MGSIHNPFALLDDDSDSESPVVAAVKEQPKKKQVAAKKPVKAAAGAGAAASRAPKHGGKDRQSASGRRSDGARKGGRGPHGFGNKNATTEEHVQEAVTSEEKPQRERRERREPREEQEPEVEEPEGKSYEEYLKELKLVDAKTETRGVNEGNFKGIKAAKVAEVVYDFDEEEEMFRIKDTGALKKRKNKVRKEKKNLAAELLPGLSAAPRAERSAPREFNGERRGNSGRGRGGSRGGGRGGSRGGAPRGASTRGPAASRGPSSKGFNALASNERDFPSLGK